MKLMQNLLKVVHHKNQEDRLGACLPVTMYELESLVRAAIALDDGEAIDPISIERATASSGIEAEA